MVSLQVKEDLLELLAATCLMIATRGERDAQLPSDADFERVTGLQVRWCCRSIGVGFRA